MEKKQIKVNFHLHSTGSDGKMAPEEVVKEAIGAGIDYMCFTDHYKQPEGIIIKDWEPITDIFSESYIKEIKRLQKEYKNKIDISFGAETELLEGYEAWIKKELEKQNFDYVLGSVHDLFKDNESFEVSGDRGEEGKKEWIKSAEKLGGVKNFVKEYYKQIKKIAESGLFDSIGHFDIIKMYNREQDLFNENEGWYRKEVLSALDAVAKAGMALEINVRGLVKYPKTQFPSLWILKESKKRNIPVTIATDAHREGQVGENIDRAYELARQAGYKEIVRFKARKKISIPIV